ncbi:hypothetical protein GUJ93_ZPchr0011g27453 [Zizania palustris]|uniref:Uncharacterized protein n=1 Tax=Zizania palustris TaxID=103762 RepID=A0A8J6BQJ5_ZIZPA|nr:hypothetical protein GUJ93_ZPchr0011g27453 [Zizania palustris]
MRRDLRRTYALTVGGRVRNGRRRNRKRIQWREGRRGAARVGKDPRGDEAVSGREARCRWDASGGREGFSGGVAGTRAGGGVGLGGAAGRERIAARTRAEADSRPPPEIEAAALGRSGAEARQVELEASLPDDHGKMVVDVFFPQHHVKIPKRL